MYGQKPNWIKFKLSFTYDLMGEPLWLSGKVVKNENINELKRTRVRSPPRATSLKIKKNI
jgi:hypothetical protein